MPERADTLEVIGLIMFAPLLYSMFICGFVCIDTDLALPAHAHPLNQFNLMKKTQLFST